MFNEPAGQGKILVPEELFKAPKTQSPFDSLEDNVAHAQNDSPGLCWNCWLWWGFSASVKVESIVIQLIGDGKGEGEAVKTKKNVCYKPLNDKLKQLKNHSNNYYKKFALFCI